MSSVMINTRSGRSAAKATLEHSGKNVSQGRVRFMVAGFRLPVRVKALLGITQIINPDVVRQTVPEFPSLKCHLKQPFKAQAIV